MAAWTGSIKSIANGSVARSAAIIAVGTVGAQAINVIASPAITRLYRPEDLGVLSLYSSVLSVLLVLSCMRYDYAIVLPKEDSVAKHLAALSFLILAILTIFIWALTSVLRPTLTHTKFSPLTPYLFMLPLGLILGGTAQILSSLAQRDHSYWKIAFSKLGNNAALTLTQILIGLSSAGPIGLMIAYPLASAARSFIVMARRPGAMNSSSDCRTSTSALLIVARTYKRFPLITIWSAIVNTAGLSAPSILFVTFYSAEVAGQFSLAQRVVALPLHMIGDAVAQSYYSHAAKLRHDNPKGLLRLFDRTVLLLTGLAVPPLLFLAIFAPVVFSFVFGNEWNTAGLYTRLLLPSFCAQLIVSSVSLINYVIGIQGRQLAWDVFRLASVIGIFAIGHSSHWPPSKTLFFLSVVQAVTYTLLFFIYRNALKTLRS